MWENSKKFVQSNWKPALVGMAVGVGIGAGALILFPSISVALVTAISTQGVIDSAVLVVIVTTATVAVGYVRSPSDDVHDKAKDVKPSSSDDVRDKAKDVEAQYKNAAADAQEEQQKDAKEKEALSQAGAEHSSVVNELEQIKGQLDTLARVQQTIKDDMSRISHQQQQHQNVVIDKITNLEERSKVNSDQNTRKNENNTSPVHNRHSMFTPTRGHGDITTETNTNHHRGPTVSMCRQRTAQRGGTSNADTPNVSQVASHGM